MMKYIINTIKVLLLTVIVMLTACDTSDQRTVAPVSRDESGIPVYDPGLAYAYEDLDDPEFYKYPRLQFVMTVPGKDIRKLMSIRTDGTDLRQVVDTEKLVYDGASDFMHKPVRSPDRRYLAYSNTGISLPDRVMYDLKTNERITIIKSQTGKAQYFWSPDSNNLFFHGDEMYRYHVPSKTLHKLQEFIYGAGFYVLPNNKTILVVTTDGIAYHDFEGKILKKFDLGFKTRQVDHNTVTLDGKELFLYDRNPTSIWMTLKPAPEIRKKLDLPIAHFFGPISNKGNSKLYLTDNKGHVSIFDLSTSVATNIFRIKTIMTNFSLMY